MKFIRIFMRSILGFLLIIILFLATLIYLPLAQPLTTYLVKWGAGHYQIHFEDFSGVWGSQFTIDKISWGNAYKVKAFYFNGSLYDLILRHDLSNIEMKAENFEIVPIQDADSTDANVLKDVYQMLDWLSNTKFPKIKLNTLTYNHKNFPVALDCIESNKNYQCKHTVESLQYDLVLQPNKIDFTYHINQKNVFNSSGSFHYQANIINLKGNISNLIIPHLKQPIQIQYDLTTTGTNIHGKVQADLATYHSELILSGTDENLRAEIKVPAGGTSFYPSLAEYEFTGDLHCNMHVNLAQSKLLDLNCGDNSISGRQKYLDLFALVLHSIQLNQDVIELQDISLYQNKARKILGNAALSLKEQHVSSHIDLSSLSLFFNHEYKIDLDGGLDLEVDPKAGRVNGAIQIKHFLKKSQKFYSANIATIETEDLNRKEKQSSSSYPFTVDLVIDSDKEISVKDKGVSLFLLPHLEVSGDISNLLVKGHVKITKGTVELLQHQFEVLNGEVRIIHDETSMNINLQTDYEQYRFRIQISGSPKKPRIRLLSTPSLPSKEIIARLLFGSSFDELSPMQVVQLLKVLDSFRSGSSGQAVPNVTDNLKSLLKLDSLVLGHLPGRGYGVGLVKQISPSTSIGISQGMSSATPEASIKVKISKQLELRGKAGSVNEPSSIELKWKRDF